jgi:hypothetical protein
MASPVPPSCVSPPSRRRRPNELAVSAEAEERFMRMGVQPSFLHACCKRLFVPGAKYTFLIDNSKSTSATGGKYFEDGGTESTPCTIIAEICQNATLCMQLLVSMGFDVEVRLLNYTVGFPNRLIVNGDNVDYATVSINEIRPRGSTPLLDRMQEITAAHKLDGPPTHTVVIFTDGCPDYSSSGFPYGTLSTEMQKSTIVRVLKTPDATTIESVFVICGNDTEIFRHYTESVRDYWEDIDAKILDDMEAEQDLWIAHGNTEIRLTRGLYLLNCINGLPPWGDWINKRRLEPDEIRAALRVHPPDNTAPTSDGRRMAARPGSRAAKVPAIWVSFLVTIAACYCMLELDTADTQAISETLCGYASIMKGFISFAFK